MKVPLFKPQQQPGFRLSCFDIVFVILLIVLSLKLREWFPGSFIWSIPVYLGASFFLFCNVFRIGNRLEILWYLPFVLLAVYQLNGKGDWYEVWLPGLIGLELLKWMLIGFKIVRGPYYGIAYQVINQRFNR